MKKIHKATSDHKLKWWGYGEWVEECDEFSFEHEGFICLGYRIFDKDWLQIPLDILLPDRTTGPFGGHWCGYVIIPEEHPYFEKTIEYFDLDIHGGITFANFMDDKEFMIGFDCAHFNDIVPSMISINECAKKLRPEWLKETIEKLKMDKHPLFSPTYKNENFVIQKCKSLAEQCKFAIVKEK